MTPKEKAVQIVNSYELVLRPLFGINDYAEKYYHKQCALVAVDEMLNELDHIPFHDDDYAQWKMKYWKQVKTEIEKL